MVGGGVFIRDPMLGYGVSPSLEILPRRGPQDLNWVGEGYLPWLGGVNYLARDYKHWLWYLRSMTYLPLSKVGTPGQGRWGGRGMSREQVRITDLKKYFRKYWTPNNYNNKKYLKKYFTS